MFILRNNKVLKKKKINLSGTQIISMGFVVIIFLGATLLTLPVASKSGEAVPFIDALFTATTSTCVTGLIIADTYTHWTVFGHIVILMLIQIGGLGFMAIAALFALLLNKKIGIRQRLLMSESISLSSMSGIVRMMQKILICTISFEFLGALVLSIRFVPEFGWGNGIFKSVFHAVSAFCNAGIDLMGEKGQYSSLTAYVKDPLVNITICALIIIGGLGFYVWEDLWRYKERKKLRLHTKLVLITTSILIFGGAILILGFEFSNAKTMSELNLFEKMLASGFQSVTARTAGFNTVDFAGLSNGSVLVIMILMFIGGSPGSTAGGVKTTTIGILMLTAKAVVRGSSHVNIFGRKISKNQVLRALAIIVMSIAVVCISSVLLFAFDDLPFKETIFEVISAFGTVGLSLGITSSLSTASKLVIIILMYFGRVGILTAVFAIAKKQHSYEDRIAYPKESVLF